MFYFNELTIGDMCVLGHVLIFATPWTAACQAPLSMRLPRQEYWSGLPFSTPRDLPNPGVETTSPAPSVLAGRFLTTEPPGIHRHTSVVSFILELPLGHLVHRHTSVVSFILESVLHRHPHPSSVCLSSLHSLIPICRTCRFLIS